MLASLDEVLWEGAGNWNPPNLRETSWYDPLEKVYTEACLFVYPDNHIGLPHYNLAKAIYKELTNSMARYNRSARREVKFCRLKLLL